MCLAPCTGGFPSPCLYISFGLTIIISHLLRLSFLKITSINQFKKLPSKPNSPSLNAIALQ